VDAAGLPDDGAGGADTPGPDSDATVTGDVAAVPCPAGAPDGAPCNDGSECTLEDHCASGECVGTALICDDGNQCTVDACLKDLGCVHPPVSGGCEDGDKCTTGDYCEDEQCKPGKPAYCEDGNVCTADSCDPATGCVHQPVDGECGPAHCEGMFWVGAAACAQGSCVKPAPVPCNDPNPCNVEKCDAVSGCSTMPLADGSPCASAGVCKGACAAGQCAETAVEQCNGGDDNCNGLVDEGFPNLDGDSMADCVDPDDDNDMMPDNADCQPQNAAVPSCSGKQCGDDGCGGQCGGCGGGLYCNHTTLQCTPCGDTTFTGYCNGCTVVWCSEAGDKDDPCPSGGACQLNYKDCEDDWNKCCGWNDQQKYYGCVWD
jgi:hypothetical protein